MIKKNSKFSVLKTIGIVALIIIGLVVIIGLFGSIKFETTSSEPEGNVLTTCKSKRIVISVGNFSLPIGKGISMGCVY